MTGEADRARAAAEDTGEAIRTMNHATRHPGDFVVVDVYRIVGALAAAQHRLKQATEQLAAILAARIEHGGLGDDTGSDPIVTTRQAAAFIVGSGELADQASQFLDDAHNMLSAISDPPTAPRRSDAHDSDRGHD